ncbi:hypothetical protein D3C81_1686120 [compost metagenome]
MFFRPLVIRFAAHDEVNRRAVRALVQPLEERVLAVRARHAPDRRAGGYADGVAGHVHGFSQRFHVQLL